MFEVGLLSWLRHVRYTVSPIAAWTGKSCRRFDHVALVFFRAKIVHSGNLSVGVRPARLVESSVFSGQPPSIQGTQACVSVEAFLSWGHLDVDGFLDQQLPWVPGHVNHCGLIPLLAFHACSAAADFSRVPFRQASWCSLSLVSSLLLVSLM